MMSFLAASEPSLPPLIVIVACTSPSPSTSPLWTDTTQPVRRRTSPMVAPPLPMILPTRWGGQTIWTVASGGGLGGGGGIAGAQGGASSPPFRRFAVGGPA